MNWEKVLALKMISIHSFCQLIIIGETEENLPFCYEHRFKVQRLNREQCTVSLDFGAINPLEKLKEISFIEMSFRDKGVMYYSFVHLLERDIQKNKCILTLSAPEALNTYENRRFVRVSVPAYTPISCRITGVRSQMARQGISLKGEVLEISAGGLSFVSSTRLFYPLFLELNFSLPNNPEPISLYGEIMRVSHFNHDSYRIAVEFRNASENTINKIDQYCNL